MAAALVKTPRGALPLALLSSNGASLLVERSPVAPAIGVPGDTRCGRRVRKSFGSRVFWGTIVGGYVVNEGLFYKVAFDDGDVDVFSQDEVDEDLAETALCDDEDPRRETPKPTVAPSPMTPLASAPASKPTATTTPSVGAAPRPTETAIAPGPRVQELYREAMRASHKRTLKRPRGSGDGLPRGAWQVRLWGARLYAKILARGDHVILNEFVRTADGDTGEMEATGRVRLGDVLVAVEKTPVSGMNHHQVSELIHKAPRPITLTFMRLSDDNDDDEATGGEKRPRAATASPSPPIEQRQTREIATSVAVATTESVVATAKAGPTIGSTNHSTSDASTRQEPLAGAQAAAAAPPEVPSSPEVEIVGTRAAHPANAPLRSTSALPATEKPVQTQLPVFLNRRPAPARHHETTATRASFPSSRSSSVATQPVSHPVATQAPMPNYAPQQQHLRQTQHRVAGMAPTNVPVPNTSAGVRQHPAQVSVPMTYAQHFPQGYNYYHQHQAMPQGRTHYVTYAPQHMGSFTGASMASAALTAHQRHVSSVSAVPVHAHGGMPAMAVYAPGLRFAGQRAQPATPQGPVVPAGRIVSSQLSSQQPASSAPSWRPQATEPTPSRPGHADASTVTQHTPSTAAPTPAPTSTPQKPSTPRVDSAPSSFLTPRAQTADGETSFLRVAEEPKTSFLSPNQMKFLEEIPATPTLTTTARRSSQQVNTLPHYLANFPEGDIISVKITRPRLYLTLETMGPHVSISSFVPDEDGRPGEVEASGLVLVGDVLVGVESIEIRPFMHTADVARLVTGLARPLHLYILRSSWDMLQ